MIVLMLSVALMAAAPAAGEPAAQPAAKAEKPKKEDMVCKREKVIGSRLPVRVCMTQADWDQRAADDKANLDAAQRNRGLSSN